MRPHVSALAMAFAVVAVTSVAEAWRYEPILQELVSLKCDVIVTSGTPMARVARGVTSTVPIVMVSVSDAQIAGLVTSLARPGGNLTGLSDFGPDLEGKRLELLRQAMPKAVRIAVLQSKATRDSAWGKAQQVAAASLGFTLVHAEFGPDDQSGLAAIEGQRPDAVYVGPGLFAEGKRQLIVDFARRSRLPLMGPNRLFVESGGLMSYASEFANYQRGVAEYVDRILRGAKPADLPIQRPQKLKLVVNLKTAKALGLTLPDAFVSRADQRIQ